MVQNPIEPNRGKAAGINLGEGALPARTPRPITPPRTTIKERQISQEERTAVELCGNTIADQHQINPILGRILAERGFHPGSELERFLRPHRELLPDPINLRGAQRFCEILSGAARAKNKIGIIHDYDVDGTMSAVILASTLKTLQIPCTLLPPDRKKHGYGAHPELIRAAARRGCKILCCLDLGTTNHAEIELARELGMKVVVIDHHELQKNGANRKSAKAPRAHAFINPHQDGCGFSNEHCCAAALTWFAVGRLKQHLAGSRRARSRLDASRIDLEHLMGYAALATVADVVPLRGTNRTLVHLGLQELERSTSPGVRALLDHADLRNGVSARDIAFRIAPRINAAGRLLEPDTRGTPGAALVTKLFLTNRRPVAQQLAALLSSTNQQRKEIEGTVVHHAERLLHECSTLPDGIVLWSEQFHPGVIGLAAARIAERYHRPTLIFQVNSDGSAKCSARSGVQDFSIIEAFRDLEHAVGGSVFGSYGGHEGAGGATVRASDLPLIRTAWDSICSGRLATLSRVPTIKPDAEISLEEVSRHGAAYLRELELLEPLGVGNPEVKFLIRGVQILATRVIKGRHLELTIKQRAPESGKDSYGSAILWHHTDHPALTDGGKPTSDPVNLVCFPQTQPGRRSTTPAVTLQIIAAERQELRSSERP